jgi:ABC-2 type transport system ATP-binding protein
MSAAIDVVALDKTVAVGFWGRKVKLLDEVSFTVAQGSTTGFIGKNGAGKSTTIKHIIGGAKPTEGSVRVFGEDPAKPATRKKFGYMPELPYLPPTLTPVEMMKLHAALAGVDASKGDALLERVDLAADKKKRVGSFSKGMQTRLSLALALLHEPELLILDEPMSGLDPVGRQLVRELLREQGQKARTIFFSSHVLADVEALCDAVILIDRQHDKPGRIVHTGTTAQAVGELTGAWSVRVVHADATKLAGVRDVKREGDTFVVVLDASDAVSAAEGLQKSGARVLSIEPKRKSLEEVVIEKLGRAS